MLLCGKVGKNKKLILAQLEWIMGNFCNSNTLYIGLEAVKKPAPEISCMASGHLKYKKNW
jgi:hypothetical protein